MRRLIPMLMLSVAMTAGPAWAQGDSSGTPPAERPATATYWGDTGLWFVPTAETLRSKGWSFSLYRTEMDFNQGVTDISDWPLTFAVGAGPRTELFGAIRVVTRIDRDLRPLFEPGAIDEGGLVNDRPFVRETWTGNDFGDIYFGGKVNLLTERRQHPFAAAVRASAKAPTADTESGAGTGKWDYFLDGIFSKEFGRRVEATGSVGYAWRTDPLQVNLVTAFGGGRGSHLVRARISASPPKCSARWRTLTK
jgi:hypothetical protein